jgi:hypothetical protein
MPFSMIAQDMSLRSATIVIAGCDTPADSRAMGRWVMPVLKEWPDSAWHLWLVDATDCENVLAAAINDDTETQNWQAVEPPAQRLDDAICKIAGGRTGLVLFAHETIANHATRAMEGLVAAMTSFPASDPLAKPLKNSFASFGVLAGI